jgi:hypothetical protein
MHMRVPDPLPPLCEPPSRPDLLPWVIAGIYVALVAVMFVIGYTHRGLVP